MNIGIRENLILVYNFVTFDQSECIRAAVSEHVIGK